MDGGGKVACVTGASGYIASWIVKLLLLRGYTVKATVRDPNDRKKTEHLLALDGTKDRLKLFKADLLEEGSFQQAIDGCDSVFHTASPVTLTVSSDPQIELIDPAVKVLAPETKLGPNDVVDETFFTDPCFAEEKKQWYVLSKTLAEDAAWRFAKANEMDLIVINPGLVIGPVLHSSLNFSVAVIAELMKGKNPLNTSHHRFVDVRDVALAHVKALETPSANGRYIIDGPVVAMNDIQNVLREFLPDLCIADRNEDIKELNSVTYKTCLEKVKNLGINELIPTETSLRDLFTYFLITDLYVS
ncbi:PREDICTED: cinnamoyl-CoA reductase 1-like isoform X3 [Camelina sativa]|uniref:Cinnamoyl-CoA reductase 1-like isoform X3 n=1 Tax=Camelina sativa TaxID=90675 RepID=A0ABM0VM09_CAMSA|nr:PREDICTED: cinnamoyl-CoA reductase 1-like isoform X3 [Camelina sativa]